MGISKTSIVLVAFISFTLTTSFETMTAGNGIHYQDYKITTNEWMDNKAASEISAIALKEAKHFLSQAYTTNVTQMDLIQHIESIMHAEGADPALSFAPLVYSGDDHHWLHGDPLDDFTQVIDPAIDPVVTVDLGAKVNGQCSDVTRTFFFDSASQEMINAYQDVLDTHEALLAAMKAGVPISHLDEIYRSMMADYIAREDVYVHMNWGHGVGDHVHEYPPLNNKTTDILHYGQVLAVEPNAFFFHENWSVRVEDTIRVKLDGVEIFSKIPTDVDNVTVLPDNEPFAVSMTNDNYSYGCITTAGASITGQTREISNVSFYDGYNWELMEKSSETSYEHEYFVDSTYSGLVTGIVKIVSGNETFYFTKELVAEPDGYLIIEEPLTLSGFSTDLFLDWEISIPEATMLRAHFTGVKSPPWDQLVLTEESGKIIYDFRDRGNLVDVWSPWIAGSKIALSYFPTEEYILDYFEFSIDKIEYINETIEQEISPEISTETTETTAVSTASSYMLVIVLIALSLTAWKKRRSL